jgi:hypothetical protein
MSGACRVDVELVPSNIPSIRTAWARTDQVKEAVPLCVGIPKIRRWFDASQVSVYVYVRPSSASSTMRMRASDSTPREKALPTFRNSPNPAGPGTDGSNWIRSSKSL